MADHWTMPWYDLVAKYMHMQFGYTPAIEEYMEWKVSERRSAYLNALAFFKLERHYFSLEDVPDKFKKDHHMIWIRGNQKSTQYIWSNEQWMEIGSVHDELYKRGESPQ